MSLLEIASILFSCVAVNHLGLVAAIEKVIGRSLPVVNCPKCLTFWSVLIFSTLFSDHSPIFHGEPGGGILLIALSFLSAWSAIWLDLLMGYIDHLYLKIYGKIYSTANPADTDALPADDSLSGLP